MLRRDPNAELSVDEWRFLLRKRRRYWFVGTGCAPTQIAEEEYRRFSQEQVAEPALVTVSGERQYWWFEDKFYWDNERFSSQDVKALLVKRERSKRQTLEHARSVMALESATGVQGVAGHRRDGIPEDVRRFVFRRDAGACQECGSNELLQFDHIIPVTLGGSSEPENLQLLCARCNREKSDRI